MNRELYPRWFQRLAAVWHAPGCLLVLGFGIAYLVMGNTAGKIIGVVLIVLAVVLGRRLAQVWRR
jgi:hypothetical protein